MIRQHLQEINAGHYGDAFTLMSPDYRAHNPSWPTNRSAADPGIHVISIGASTLTSGAADVPVDFYARDRNPTPGSDTRCREFKGTVDFVKQDGKWEYNPSGNRLNSTVMPQGDPNCPS